MTLPAHKLQPHRVRTFKRSRDPGFATKLTDIVGLYMDPPTQAVVLSIDEKSPDPGARSHATGLPIKPGRCGTMTQNPVAAEYAMGQADAAGVVPWPFFHEKTGEFLTTADIPTLWTDGRGGPQSDSVGLTQSVDGRNGWTPDVAHQPDLSFIPYLMTGRRYFLDQQNAQADFTIVAQWPAAETRNGGEGIIVGPSEQVRGDAWKPARSLRRCLHRLGRLADARLFPRHRRL